MRVAAVTICILSALAIVCNGGEFFGSRFSVVTLPFKYHKIVPDFIDEGPRELLQVSDWILVGKVWVAASQILQFS